MNDDVNEEWISDKTRFAIDGLKVQRLLNPMVKGPDGVLKPASWEEALFTVAQQLRDTPAELKAAVVGGLADVESMLALKDLFNRFNSEKLCTEEQFPETSGGTDLRSNYVMNDGIAGVEECDALLLVGTNPRFEAPVLNARIRKAYLYSNIEIGVIGGESDLTYDYAHLGNNASVLDDVLAGKSDFAKTFLASKKPMVIVGSAVLEGENGPAILAKLQELASKVRSGSATSQVLNVLHRNAGQVGALDLGYKAGTSVLRQKPIKFLYLLGADEGKVSKQNLDPSAFIVYQGHHGDAGASIADVVLPGAAYTEKEATYVNTEGRSQRALPAVSPPGDARVDWKIIRALSEVAGKTLPYDDLKQLRQRMTEVAPHLVRYGDIEAPILVKQAGQLSAGSGSVNADVTPAQKELADFYITNVVTRNSSLMAQARKAALKAKEDPYNEVPKIHAHA